MAVYEVDGIAPRIAESAWVADSAQVMGDVDLGEEVGVWFGVVVRGDTAQIALMLPYLAGVLQILVRRAP